MKWQHILLAGLCLVACCGCDKQFHIIIVNRYPTDVVFVEEVGAGLRIPAGGTGLLYRTIQNGKKFNFDVPGKGRITHEVSEIGKRLRDGIDDYVIDLDPASKGGAGQDKFPVAQF